MGIENKDPANFSPSVEIPAKVDSFRFWCQKVLPLVYDDSLSYYELLCKVVDYLNNTIADVNTLGADVDNINNAYNELQSYVNDYFSTLDVQNEINNKLDVMASDGTLSNLLAPFINEFTNVLVVNNISEMTNTNRLYLLTSDSNLYYYNGSNWITSGTNYGDLTNFIKTNNAISISNFNLNNITTPMTLNIIVDRYEYDDSYPKDLAYGITYTLTCIGSSGGTYQPNAWTQTLVSQLNSFMRVGIYDRSNNTIGWQGWIQISLNQTASSIANFNPDNVNLNMIKHIIVDSTNYNGYPNTISQGLSYIFTCNGQASGTYQPNVWTQTLVSQLNSFMRVGVYDRSNNTIGWQGWIQISLNQTASSIANFNPDNVNLNMIKHIIVDSTNYNGYPNTISQGLSYIFTCNGQASGTYQPNVWTQTLVSQKNSFIRIGVYDRGNNTIGWQGWVCTGGTIELTENINIYTWLKELRALNTNIIIKGKHNLYDEIISDTPTFFDNYTGQTGLTIGYNNNYIFDTKASIELTIPSNKHEFYNTLTIFNTNTTNFTLTNANLIAQDCRYCVHDELGGQNGGYAHNYINCNMKNTSTIEVTYSQCIGGGLGNNGYINIDGGYYEVINNTGTVLEHEACISYHNALDSEKVGAKSNIYIKNVYCHSNNNKGTIRGSWYGYSNEISKMYVTNCRVEQNIVNTAEQSWNNFPENLKVIKWNNTIENN